MSIHIGQTYRNSLGAVLTITGHAALSGLNTIGEIWVAESPDKLFGPRQYFVTAEGIEGAGYEEVSEP